MLSLNQLKQALAYWLQPDCAFCTAPRLLDSPICQNCFNALPWCETATLLKQQWPVYSAFYYQLPLRRSFVNLKFAKQLANSGTLSPLIMHGLLRQIPALPQAILPVPLHHKRLQQRGFNQALELVKPMAKTLNIPLLSTAVVRQKYTQAQSALDYAQRQTNVTDAFALAQHLPYQHIAIFDDVITTGATVAALAELLTRSGVKQVEIWSFARTQAQIVERKPAPVLQYPLS
jgi:ComF family protein